MRVLVVTNMYPTEAAPWAGTFVEQQVESLRRVGVSVDLLFLNRLHDGFRVYRGLARRLRAHISDRRPDIVHVMYGGFMAEVVTREVNDAPVFVSFCGSDLLGEPGRDWIRRLAIRAGILASRMAAGRANGIIVKSENLRRALPRRVDTRKVWVIPNGVDIGRFQPMEAAVCRAKLGWDPEAQHILFPSPPENMVKRFGLARIAVDRLRSAGTRVELHPLPRVPHREVAVWLNACDCLLVTSEHEGSPNIVKEALACNRPVVSVDVGDVRERLKGVSGCAVVADDAGDLAAAVADVLSGGRREGIPGRARMEGISLDRTAGQILDAYAIVRDTFVGGGHSPASKTNREGEVA